MGQIRKLIKFCLPQPTPVKHSSMWRRTCAIKAATDTVVALCRPYETCPVAVCVCVATDDMPCRDTGLALSRHMPRPATRHHRGRFSLLLLLSLCQLSHLSNLSSGILSLLFIKLSLAPIDDESFNLPLPSSASE